MPGANENPYLWQLLLGRFPAGVTHPWLHAPAPDQMPDLFETCGPMDAALSALPKTFDYVHLSNILDWLAPEEAGRLLEHAYEALRPGGLTLVRQLNSTLDIPSLGDRFEWLSDEAAALHERDRSFFYRALHVGSKQ
jgi:S-adenosylmethionine-diacylglycerol 3-amino-3-carboxypropyl transferase